MNVIQGPAEQPLNRLLKMAVLAGVETAVRIHIRRGDDLNARDSNGMTPLMLAASKNKSSVCTLLLSAGANGFLTDPLGRDALAIAKAAGATETVSILDALAPEKAVRPAEKLPIVFEDSGIYQREGSKAFMGSLVSQPIPESSLLEIETYIFDLSGWEPEEISLPPDRDETRADAQVAVQRSISTYKPIDTSEDWDDFDAFLPGRASPLPKSSDEEGQGLRSLILRGYREGSVPEREVEAFCAHQDGTRNEEGEALLLKALGEVNSGIDERNETELWTDYREESEVEEEQVALALEFLEGLGSTRYEPLRLYVKEMSKKKLLTSGEELSLGRLMEETMARALDALACWPEGVAFVLATEGGMKVDEVEEVPMDEMVELFPVQPTALLFESNDLQEVNAELISEINTPIRGASESHDQIEEIRRLASNAGSGGPGEAALREAIGSARLAKTTLFELSSVAKIALDGAAMSFSTAMSGYVEARERMTVSNLRLVLHIAKRYRDKGLLFDDLVQEGNLGLLKAVERFDWRKGFRFSTYATWWIRQQMTRALADQGKTIRTPVHVHDTILRISREIKVIEAKEGKQASVAALAERLSISEEKISTLLLCMNAPLPIHEFEKNDAPPAEFLDEHLSSDPFQLVARLNECRAIANVLSELDPRTARVLSLRFGLDDDDGHTLEEIGAFFDVTRERIRQIESIGLRKLRQLSKVAVLRDLLEVTSGRKKREESVGESEITGQNYQEVEVVTDMERMD